MKTSDHLALSKWLLYRSRQPLRRSCSFGVLLGSVLPDCNLFTYLRGIPRHQGLHGHNAEATEGKVGKLIEKAQKNGISGFLRGVRFGVSLHYLADAFTYPHHAYYPGTLRDHMAYEKELHGMFERYLWESGELPWTCADDLMAYLEKMLDFYRDCHHSERTDCRFITAMCGLAFESVVNRQENEEVLHEDSDYDRLVPSVR